MASKPEGSATNASGRQQELTALAMDPGNDLMLLATTRPLQPMQLPHQSTHPLPPPSPFDGIMLKQPDSDADNEHVPPKRSTNKANMLMDVAAAVSMIWIALTMLSWFVCNAGNAASQAVTMMTESVQMPARADGSHACAAAPQAADENTAQHQHGVRKVLCDALPRSRASLLLTLLLLVGCLMGRGHCYRDLRQAALTLMPGYGVAFRTTASRDAFSRHQLYCFQAGAGFTEDTLFLDSAASRTIISNTSLLTNIRPLPCPRTVQGLTGDR